MLWSRKKTIITSQNKEEPEDAMPEKQPTELDKWNAKLAGYQKLAARVTADANGKPEVPEDVRAAFRALTDLPESENNFKVFVGAQIDVDKGILLAQSGAMAWWHLHTGRAFAGDLDGLRRVNDALTKAGHKVSHSSALSWVSHGYSLVEGYKNKITVGVLQQLVDWGADVNHDNGSWLGKAMRSLNEKGIAPFMTGGADAGHVLRNLEELSAEDEAQCRLMKGVLRGMTLDGKVDDQTLLKATFSPDGAVLKTYFNFAARRVQEVHMSVGKDSAMATAHFRDYDSGAIEAAQKALQKLGGKPTPYTRPDSLGFG